MLRLVAKCVAERHVLRIFLRRLKPVKTVVTALAFETDEFFVHSVEVGLVDGLHVRSQFALRARVHMFAVDADKAVWFAGDEAPGDLSHPIGHGQTAL